MALVQMYPAKAGSPETTTTALLSETATEVSVAELSCFPAVGAEGGNLLTLWNDTLFETCLYTAKSAASGAGTLTIVRSGTAHASTSGGGIEWPIGTKIARPFTAYDYDSVKSNIETLDSGKVDNDELSPLGLSLVGETTATAMRDLIGSASSTTATQAIYVDKAATGTGDGTSWTNAFTTIQAAVDSLPAIINHAVTIRIRKGATPYDENVTVQRVVAAGSITLRGEYYWYGTVAASKTGKITLGVSDYGYADRAQIAVGDIVWATKWSGDVGASAPTESIIDIVASVSGAEVSLTTNTGKTIDTSWTYYIMHTKFAFTGSNRITLLLGSVLIYGIHLHSIDAARIAAAYAGSKMTSNTCAITSDVTASCISGESRAHVAIGDTLIKSNGSGVGIHLLGRSLLDMTGCVLSGLNNGLNIGSSDSNNWIATTHIMNTVNVGIAAAGNSYIRVATGSYATLNEAVTPKSPATSSEGSYIQ